MQQPDTLIFIQASMGPASDGKDRFPKNAAALLDGSWLTTTRFVYERMAGQIDWQTTKPCILTNDIDAVGVDETGGRIGLGDIIVHRDLMAGTALCDYLADHRNFKYVVRLLGNHTLTDFELVAETLRLLKEQPNKEQLTKKLGPNVCEFGQNIEVLRAETLLAVRDMVTDPSREAEIPYAENFPAYTDKRAHFEEHITPFMHSMSLAPGIIGWQAIDPAEKEKRMTETFAPYISPLPGYVQEQSRRNVMALIRWSREQNIPLTFANIRRGWDQMKLGFGEFKQTGERPKGNSFAALREAIRKGWTTVADLEIEGHGSL